MDNNSHNSTQQQLSDEEQAKRERKLLEEFVVNHADLENLEAQLAGFNIFEAIGAVRQELRHSDFLSFLLNPSKNHGLGDYFLKEFLKAVLVKSSLDNVSAIDIDVSSMDSAEIFREWQNMDILIRDDTNGIVCVIENKIGTTDSKGQLNRYEEIASKEFPKHKKILVYLTPDGDPPTDDSASEEWLTFSYQSIATLLEFTLNSKRSVMGPDVVVLTEHYLTMIGRHIVSESISANLCIKIYKAHKEAIDLILEHRPDRQMELRYLLEEIIKESSPNSGLVLDHCSKGYIRFGVVEWDNHPAQKTCDGWTSTKRLLLFEFQNYPSDLTLKLVLGPGDLPVRQAFFQTATSKKGVFKRASRRFSPKWTQLYAKTFLSKTDVFSGDLATQTEKVRKNWGDFIAQDLPEIIGAVEWPNMDNLRRSSP